MRTKDSTIPVGRRQRHLADRVKQLRKERGWSQELLAGLIGVDRQTVNRIELCRTVPNVLTVLRIADAFGRSLDRLMDGDPGPDDA